MSPREGPADVSRPADPERRTLLKAAGAAAVITALPACSLEDRPPRARAEQRRVTVDRTVLDAAAEIVLPTELGLQGQRHATDAFVQWIEQYEPVAEEMHGYGYAEIRYLPADPAPNWSAQLDALDRLAEHRHGRGFVACDRAERAALIDDALRPHAADRLPAPLAAPHVLLALVAHWAAQPDAWDLAFGARIARNTCRDLDDAVRPPIPLEPRGLS